jgi:N-methylhydantoinase B/oxoprolinase/acetone carboxylase alpha subunit
MHGRLMTLSWSDLVKTIRSVTVEVSIFMAAVLSATIEFMVLMTAMSLRISQITTPSRTALKPTNPACVRGAKITSLGSMGIILPY